MVRSKCALYGLLILSALPAQAWEFTPGLPCLLTHETPDVSVELTYDPGVPRYTISLSRPQRFSPAAVFSMTFIGPFPLTISTDRHQISGDGTTLTVSDSGFGNVLNGLQFNHTAIATLGDARVPIPLAGASEPVAAFRACRPQAGA